MPLLIASLEISILDSRGKDWISELGGEQVKHDKPDLGSNFWPPKLSVCVLAELLVRSLLMAHVLMKAAGAQPGMADFLA